MPQSSWTSEYLKPLAFLNSFENEKIVKQRQPHFRVCSSINYAKNIIKNNIIGFKTGLRDAQYIVQEPLCQYHNRMLA